MSKECQNVNMFGMNLYIFLPNTFVNGLIWQRKFDVRKQVHLVNLCEAPFVTDVAICMWCFYCTWLAGYEIAAIESERLGDTSGGRKFAIECTVS